MDDIQLPFVVLLKKIYTYLPTYLLLSNRIYAGGVCKGLVAPNGVWLKAVWLERTKIGREPLSVFKIYHSSYNFHKI
jgi:hypothetical protein